MMLRILKHTPLDNSDGFSLLEVVIAAAVGIVLTMGVTSMATMSMKVNRGTELSAEQLELYSLIRQVMSKPRSCTTNLKGEVLDRTTLSPKTIALSYPRADPTNAAQWIKGAPLITNNRFGKVRVDDLLLIPFSALDPNTWMVRIRISTHKTGEIIGARDGMSEVAIQVKVDPATSKVIECVDMSESDQISGSDSAATNGRICALSSNGLMVYDPVTDTCIENPNCFSGTLNSATCPGGTVITGCSSEGVLEASAAPQVINRTLIGSGKILVTKAELYQCSTDRASNSASCQYVTDTNLTNAKCRACCGTSML